MGKQTFSSFFLFFALLSSSLSAQEPVRYYTPTAEDRSGQYSLFLLRQYLSGPFSSTHKEFPEGTVTVQYDTSDVFQQPAPQPALFLYEKGLLVEKIPFANLVGVRGVDIEYHGSTSHALGVWYQNGRNSSASPSFYLIGVRGNVELVTEIISSLQHSIQSRPACPSCPDTESPTMSVRNQELVCRDGSIEGRTAEYLGEATYSNCDYLTADAEGLEGILDKARKKKDKRGIILTCGNASTESAENCKDFQNNFQLSFRRAQEGAAYLSAQGIRDVVFVSYPLGTGLDEKSVKVFYIPFTQPASGNGEGEK